MLQDPQINSISLLVLLFGGNIDVAAGDQVVGALHEAVELALAVGTQQIGASLGDEDVVLAVARGFLHKKELVTWLGDDGPAILHP